MHYGSRLSQLLMLQLCLFGAVNVLAQEPRSAPDWLLVTQNGETISFYSDSQGQPSLLFFWTAACDHSCNANVTRLYQQAQRLHVKMYLLKTTPEWRQEPMGDLPEDLNQLDNALSVSRFYGVAAQSKIILVNQRKQIILGRPIEPNVSGEVFEQLFTELEAKLAGETRQIP